MMAVAAAVDPSDAQVMGSALIAITFRENWHDRDRRSK